MNAGHDRGDRNQCERVDSATTDFNFGYRDPNSTFRSILATDCVLNQCDNLTQKGWPRVQRFSNPDLLYDGKAMGSRTENNARQINNVRATIAAFFPAMNCRSDFECNDKDPTTVDQCNLDNSACMFTPTSDPVLTSTAPLATTSVPAPFSNGLPTVFAAPSWAPVKESPKNLLTCILDRLRSVLRLFWSNDI